MPDFGFDAFHNDAWHFVAIVGVASLIFTIPSYLWYRLKREKQIQDHTIARIKAEASLMRTMNGRVQKDKKP